MSAAEARIQAPEELPEDELDRSLRPRRLEDFVGQEAVKEQLALVQEMMESIEQTKEELAQDAGDQKQKPDDKDNVDSKSLDSVKVWVGDERFTLRPGSGAANIRVPGQLTASYGARVATKQFKQFKQQK